MTPRLTRLELALVAIIFVIGLGLRAAYPSRMAIEHFDEGVYASNLYTEEERFPFQHLYAPPLLPFCLEWAAVFGGPHAVMWVNVVSGSLTLLVLWGMVRAWWGPPAAMAAMVLLAFNEFHIAYSRAALTDAMLGLWMTAGVWAGWRAVQMGGLANLLAAGVLAGLAWWTKYNGWLTLAITGAGTAGWVLFGNPVSRERQRPEETATINPTRRKSTRSSARATSTDDPHAQLNRLATARLYLGRWLITASIAFLVWSPWLWELQQYGGYSAVAKNHAGYFTGVGKWWTNAGQQMSAQLHYASRQSQLALVIAMVGAAAWGTCTCQIGSRTRPVMMRLMLRRAPLLLSAWTIAAWVIGLTVAIPLYAPYPRLGLTLVIAICALGGVLGKAASADIVVDEQASASTVDGESMRKQRRQLWWLVPIGICIAPTYFEWFRGEQGSPLWQSRTSLAHISGDVVSRLQSQPLNRDIDGVRCVLYVVAEPGLFFHLGAAQRNSPIAHIAIPAADYGMATPGANTSGLPAYVVIGPHADHAEADRLVAAGRLEQVAEFEYRPSDLVLLDSRPAWDLPDREHPVVERVRLLHVKP